MLSNVHICFFGTPGILFLISPAFKVKVPTNNNLQIISDAVL